jgi:hypothetical protein
MNMFDATTALNSPEHRDDAPSARLRAALLAAGSPQRRTGAQARLLAATLLDLVGREPLGVAWEYTERNHESLLEADPAIAYSRFRDAALHGARSRMAARTTARTYDALDAAAAHEPPTTTASPSYVAIPPRLIKDWLEPLVCHDVTPLAAERLAESIGVYADSGSGMVANGSCNPMARHRTQASSTQRLNNNPAIRAVFGDDNFARLATCRLLVGTDRTPGLLLFLGARLRDESSNTPDIATRREWAKLLLDLDPATRTDGPCTTGSARWRARQRAADRVQVTIDDNAVSLAI